MRIALCHKRLDQNGGTERDFYLTAAGLRDLGHEIHLFCGEFAAAPPAGTFAHRVPVWPFGRTARLWSFAQNAPRIIETFDCDVVVSFGRMMTQDVLRSGGGSHKLFLRSLGAQAGPGRRLWQRLSVYHRSLLSIEKRQFEPGGCKKVIAVSQTVKRDLMSAYGIDEKKIVVLYNGVDLQRFDPALRDRWRAPIRSEWKIPVEADVILFVGSGFRRKGLDRLIEVWRAPELRDAYLLVVGEDGRAARYRARAAAEAPDRIIFAGRQERVERFYAAADILALPSVQEAFGNVVLEALACGLPVVVSREVGAAEVLQGPLACGVVDERNDPAEMVKRLAETMARARSPQTAVEARRVSERYSWEEHFRRLEAFLMELASAK